MIYEALRPINPILKALKRIGDLYNCNFYQSLGTVQIQMTNIKIDLITGENLK